MTHDLTCFCVDCLAGEAPGEICGPVPFGEVSDDGYDQMLQEMAEKHPATPKYVVSVVKNDGNRIGRYKISHESDDGRKVYTVTFGLGGMTCTCPDSKHRRPGKCKHCWHIARLVGRPELVPDYLHTKETAAGKAPF